MPAEQLITGPPDFIGVGAQRAGTTWWFSLLLEHPRIRRPRSRRKELHFFDRFGARELTDADIADYHALFARRPEQLCGEWTPRYMGDAWTPRLLRRAAPEARLLVLLRDPIERYRSGIVHRLTRAPRARRDMIASDAIERGCYAEHLTRVRRHFEPDRILVLQYEQCCREPLAQYERTLRFLGLPEGDPPPDFERPKGSTTASGKQPLWPDMEAALLRTLEPDVARLRELVPELDLGLWPNFSHMAPTRTPDDRARAA